MSRVRVVGVIAGVGLLLAGCGSTSQKSFLASANSICAGAAKQLKTQAAPGSGYPALAKSVTAQLPIDSAEVAKLAALKQPAASHKADARFVVLAQADIALLRKILPYLRASNGKEVDLIGTEGNKLSDSLVGSMTELGLTECNLSLGGG